MSSRLVPSLSFAARRQVVERMAPFYREASLAQKALLLDQVVLVTGYARSMPLGYSTKLPRACTLGSALVRLAMATRCSTSWCKPGRRPGTSVPNA